MNTKSIIMRTVEHHLYTYQLIKNAKQQLIKCQLYNYVVIQSSQSSLWLLVVQTQQTSHLYKILAYYKLYVGTY